MSVYCSNAVILLCQIQQILNIVSNYLHMTVSEKYIAAFAADYLVIFSTHASVAVASDCHTWNVNLL